jgi:DNA-binding NtrC family response regulator
MSVSGCHKVLIVDDERTIADTLAEIFSTRCGYETRAVYTAEEAMNMLAEWYPDLAILDVVLPKMNGIDLAILLTAQYPACQLLLFSGQQCTVDLLEEATRKGYKFDVLAKPSHPTVIIETAARLLAADQNKVPN